MGPALALGLGLLTGCASPVGGAGDFGALSAAGGALQTGDASETPATPISRFTLALDAGPPALGAAPSAGALYRAIRVDIDGDALSATDAMALWTLLGEDADAQRAHAVLLSLRARVDGVDLAELPVALLAIDQGGAARVFARWRHRLPALRDDLPLDLDLLARPAQGAVAEARRVADRAARASGALAPLDGDGPAWLGAPLSADAMTASASVAEAMLATGFGDPVALGAPASPDRRGGALTMAMGDGGLSLALSQLSARSALEALRPASDMAGALSEGEPALGFSASAGSGLLERARYLRAGARAETLEDVLARVSEPTAGAYRSMTRPVAGDDPRLDADCRALRRFLRTDAALTPLDRIAATVETLRAGGREDALFRSEACLPQTDRPIACAAGLLSCGSAADIDPREAIRQLADYMRWPTRSRREALAALLPDQLTVVNLSMATGAGDAAAGPPGLGDRRRLTREEALDLLAEARLNRYGDAAPNPNDPDWWVANFTRRPELRRVMTVYAAFDGGRFDDLGFVDARVDDAALADPRSWAAAQLGPLIVPCDRTESLPMANGAVLQARRPIGDCARFDDFASTARTDLASIAEPTVSATAGAAQSPAQE